MRKRANKSRCATLIDDAKCRQCEVQLGESIFAHHRQAVTSLESDREFSSPAQLMKERRFFAFLVWVLSSSETVRKIKLQSEARRKIHSVTKSNIEFSRPTFPHSCKVDYRKYIELFCGGYSSDVRSFAGDPKADPLITRKWTEKSICDKKVKHSFELCNNVRSDSSRSHRISRGFQRCLGLAEERKYRKSNFSLAWSRWLRY